MYIKILSALIVVLLLSGTTLLGYKLYQKDKELQETREAFSRSLNEANLELGRAKTVIANAQKMIGDLNTDIQKEIRQRNATLDMYAKLVAKLQTNGGGNLSTPPLPPDVKLDSLPFTYQDFRLKASGDAVKKTFQYTLSQSFELKLAEVRLPTGGFSHYAELYELDGTGKRINKLELTKFEVVRASDAKKKSISWWNPRVDIGLGVLLTTALTMDPVTSIGMSTLSYGYSIHDVSLRFLRVGLDVNSDTIGLSIAPLQINVARPLPLIDNLWLSPAVGRSLNWRPSNNYLILGITAAL